MKYLTGKPYREANLLRDEGGWLSLMSLLITLVLIMILALYMFGGTEIFQSNNSSSGPSKPGAHKYGGALGALEQGKDEVCRQDLTQARTAVQLYLSNGEGLPVSLDDLARSTSGLQTSCPVSKEPYQYDPQTGRVWCTFARHANY